MSISMYWTLIHNDQLLEFVQWLRKEYPVLFKDLAGQFLHIRE